MSGDVRRPAKVWRGVLDIWGDVRRSAEILGDVIGCEEILGDVRRCEETWKDMRDVKIFFS